MKRLMPLVILSVSCLLASSRHSHARLGETEQEIKLVHHSFCKSCVGLPEASVAS
jgi:hypothetical protein